jgi:hypothetical protein
LALQLQAELKRKAAQLDSADNKIIQLTNELAKEKEEKAELAVVSQQLQDHPLCLRF